MRRIPSVSIETSEDDQGSFEGIGEEIVRPSSERARKEPKLRLEKSNENSNREKETPRGMETAPLKDGPIPVDDKVEVVEEKASFYSSVFNMTNTIIGGGMLALPFAMHQCGLVLGSLLLLLVGVLCNFSAYLTIEAANMSHAKSYRQLAQLCLGKYGGIAVDVSMIVFLLGACVGYIVIIGDIATPFLGLLPIWGEDFNHCLWRMVLMLAVTVFILYPLTALKRIDSLRWTSALALVCIFYLVITIIIQSGMALHRDPVDVHLKIKYVSLSWDVFSVLPIIAFAFTFHMSIFPIMNEMKQPERIYGVVNWSMGICVVCYMLVSILGYLTFFDKTSDNILKNYPDGDVMIDIGKGALFFIMCFSFPLLGHTARIIFDELFFRKKSISGEDVVDYHCPRWRRIAEATGLVGIALGLGILVPGISFVFGIVGASAGNFVVYIAPGYFFIRIGISKTQMHHLISDHDWQRSDRSDTDVESHGGDDDRGLVKSGEVIRIAPLGRTIDFLKYAFHWKRFPATFLVFFGIVMTLLSLSVIIFQAATAEDSEGDGVLECKLF
eukprot:TRINITY_DN7471_c0_g1_i1.p1 TRINITY_DN7471_c0_g1~~TRINITY_DN7471_c0_g1_i1.p1  ORF type:complete len:555 (-),score=145.96 TRINITY_DN7471_c0_g1_i1:9-1673(-)